MATLNLRNESSKFIREVGGTFIHNPSGVTEDITQQFLNLDSDKIFNVYSDKDCGIFIGVFKVILRQNDGVYLNLGNVTGLKLEGDVNFKDSLVLSALGEQKLVDWTSLLPATIINVTLKSI